MVLFCFCFFHHCAGVFAHGVMGHQLNPSLWPHCAISCSSQCSTTGVTKAMVGMNSPVCKMVYMTYAAIYSYILCFVELSRLPIIS